MTEFLDRNPSPTKLSDYLESKTCSNLKYNRLAAKQHMKRIKKFNKDTKKRYYLEFIFGKELVSVDFVNVDDKWIRSFLMPSDEFIHIPEKFWKAME